MRKIKYQGGITKLIASEIGKQNKKKFSQYIDKNLQCIESELTTQPTEMEVVSFSSNRDFYDQVLSIFSFLRNVGIPVSWTIYSDGSHTHQQTEFLENNFGFIKVLNPDLSNKENILTTCKPALLSYIDDLLTYALKHPLGKKLFYYLNHTISRPTVFIDSDILFYSQASILHAIIKESVEGWYLPDKEWGCLDSRYKNSTGKQLYQVNSGFFILKNEIKELSTGLNFLTSLQCQFEYFSEQSIFHILFKENGFIPVDPRIFVLNSGDQFDFSYLYSREKIAMRHYTGPVRHKMWQRDWRWQLSLS